MILNTKLIFIQPKSEILQFGSDSHSAKFKPYLRLNKTTPCSLIHSRIIKSMNDPF